MTKFHTPQMSVIRFNESDVIVASNGIGKTLTISGLGNTASVDGLFVLGNGRSLTSEQMKDGNLFLSTFNNYLGTSYTGRSSFTAYVENEDGTIGNTAVYTLASMDRKSDDSSSYAMYNVTYTWNGSRFEYHQQ